MKNASSRKGYHLLLLVSVILIVCGMLAWSHTYHVQSAGLFAFGILLVVQWNVLRTRQAVRRSS